MSKGGLTAAAGLGAFAAAFAHPAAGQEESGFLGALEPEYTEFYGVASVEATLFPEGPRFADQREQSFSGAIEPTFFAEWAGGDVTATFTPFARIDSADRRRSHVDIREAKLDFRSGDWEATVGIDTVFWGKAEANHLVDIINTQDAIEDLDEEDPLGQPMIRVARLTEIGEFSAFFLPYVRLRTFPGENGRLRSALVVDNDDRIIERDGGRFAPSFALRYAGVIEDADIGLSFFNGVSRDPSLRPSGFVDTPGGPVPTELQPIYETITQFGFDGQYTSGPALWKAEALYRDGMSDLDGDERDYFAATGGIEYTLFGVFDNADLGLIAEYSWDSRGDDATTIFQSDVIAGARLALNDPADTSLLVTGAIDHDNGVGSIRLEAQRRVAESLIAEIEGQFFVNGDEDPLAADLQDDSFVRLKLSYYW
ncbi:MAG: hypothetical protein AAGF90_17155 [Pseudomonadota bacterium]